MGAGKMTNHYIVCYLHLKSSFVMPAKDYELKNLGIVVDIVYMIKGHFNTYFVYTYKNIVFIWYVYRRTFIT